jgi:hypothetical protein
MQQEIFLEHVELSLSTGYIPPVDEADAMAFELSTWSKFALWFVVLSSSGFAALLLFIFVASIHAWSDIDGRVLLAIPVLLLAYWGVGQFRYLFIEGPLLSTGPAGIEDKLSGFGFIPWEDVTSE